MTVTVEPAPPATTSPCGNDEPGLSLPYQERRPAPFMEPFPQHFFPPEDNPVEDALGGGSRRQPVILVVEDESIQAIFLRRTLRRLGYEAPEHAVTGPEAIERAARFSPDLILMDIRLRGDMDGITAADRIQHNLDVPVIYMTAYSDAETFQRAQETKCYGYLEKPVNNETLRTAIEAALRRREAGLDNE